MRYNKDMDRLHREKVIRKLEKIKTLRSLLDMWEMRPDQADPDYLRELRRRLRSVETQYQAMKP